jgi:hypothetical protein
MIRIIPHRRRTPRPRVDEDHLFRSVEDAIVVSAGESRRQILPRPFFDRCELFLGK